MLYLGDVFEDHLKLVLSDFFKNKTSSYEEKVSAAMDIADDNDSSFGATLVALRKDVMGFTQRNFADLLGVSVNTLRSWERGRSKPPAYVRDYIFMKCVTFMRENDLDFYSEMVSLIMSCVDEYSNDDSFEDDDIGDDFFDDIPDDISDDADII